jgi:hypothetical protein
VQEGRAEYPSIAVLRGLERKDKIECSGLSNGLWVSQRCITWPTGVAIVSLMRPRRVVSRVREARREDGGGLSLTSWNRSNLPNRMTRIHPLGLESVQHIYPSRGCIRIRALRSLLRSCIINPICLYMTTNGLSSDLR